MVAFFTDFPLINDRVRNGIDLTYSLAGCDAIAILPIPTNPKHNKHSLLDFR